MNFMYFFDNHIKRYIMRGKKSLLHLQKIVSTIQPRYVCTGHSGAVKNTVNLFSHIDESATFSRKKPFDENGPFDYTKE